ncbi:MAG TPA: tetratricopeptide repeat protein [Anaerolineae bacterium]|nr:tetratricopeptide repeat protein [Anaerolineae bacterium]
MTGNTAVSPWQRERQTWTDYYERQLHRQLAQAVVLLNSAPRPQQLKRHFDSFLVLLRRARARPDLRVAGIELLAALHPWPQRWGYWDAWEQELERAIPLLAAFGRTEQQAGMMTAVAQIQFDTGRLETAAAAARAALELAWEGRLAAAWGAAVNRYILTLNRLGQNREARRLLTQFEAQLDALPFAATEKERLEAAGHLLLRRIIFLRHDGRAAEAARRVGRLIKQLARQPQADQFLLAFLYEEHATMLWASDQYEPAVASLQKAIDLYGRIGDEFAEASARGNLGIVYWSMARLNEAEEAIWQSLRAAEAFNARWRVANEMGNLCAISLHQGRLQRALRFTERHLQLAQAVDDAAEIDRAQGNRVQILLYLERYAEVLPALRESIAQLEALEMQWQVAQGYANLSCCLYGLGRLAEGETAVNRAAALAQEIDSPLLAGLVLRCRALFASPEEAAALTEQALALARQHKHRLSAARCLLRLAVLASGERRQALWAEGEAIMREIGAEAWVNGRSPENPPTVAMIL